MIFGVTRFSVFSPSSNAWKSSREMNEREYKEYLFSHSRLSARLLIMEKYSIPILKNMAKEHDDYHHFITYSNDLPVYFKNRLCALVGDCDNLHVINHIELTDSIKSLILRCYSGRDSGVYSLFNLDDDDLLSRDYVRSLRRYVRSEFSGWAISFGLGVSALFDAESGVFFDFRECYHPKINIGLPLINDYQIGADGVNLGSLKRPSHTKIDREKVIALDSREIMWLWARHADQDTLVNKDAPSVLRINHGKLDLVSDSFFKEKFFIN